ncbi:hypothetical protein R1sor_004838 [Riccia sorocarpa]|uniref:Uncharacterized protein n=1 Tax=Riccia sorocarpa TaxID=122646 RepID=A0ABD3HI41_9MARC
MTVWGRRWIVKESTIPNTGFDIFAVDRVVVEPNTHYDQYPQLFPYVRAVYKHRQYRVMKRLVPYFLEYILDTSQRVPRGPQKRRFIDGDPVRTWNIAGYIQSVGTDKVSNAERHYVDSGHIWFHPRWNKRFHIMTVATRTIEPGDEGFDPPEVEAFSRRARRRLESLRDTTIEENNNQDEDDGEEEPLDETIAQEEAYEPEEELQNQAVLAEFFNMRFQPTTDTCDTGGNPSKLDDEALTPLCKGSRVSKLTAILMLSNLQQKYNRAFQTLGPSFSSRTFLQSPSWRRTDTSRISADRFV